MSYVPFVKDSKLEELDKLHLGQGTVYMLLAKNGIFIRKVNALYECVHEANGSTGLEELKQGLILKAKPIPRRLLEEMTAFCTEIYDRLKGEAAVIMYYNPESKEWCWDVPEQETASGGLSVDYGHLPTPKPGFVPFGTFHSHCAAGAFQSGTDAKDEAHFDGIHITVGKLDATPEYHIRVIVGGQTWTFDDLTQLVAAPVLPDFKFDEALLARVKERATRVYHVGGYQSTCSYADYAKDFQAVIPKVGSPLPTWRSEGPYDSVLGRSVAPEQSTNDVWESGDWMFYRDLYYVKVGKKWRPVPEKQRAEIWTEWERLSKDHQDVILAETKENMLRRMLISGTKLVAIHAIAAGKARKRKEDEKARGSLSGFDWGRWGRSGGEEVYDGAD